MSVHEVTVIARNAKNETTEVHAEVWTQSDDVQGAANEVLESYAREHGKERVRYVETGR